MLVPIIPNFAPFSYFTTDRFHYQLYGPLARGLKTHEGIESPYRKHETEGQRRVEGASECIVVWIS